jgi:hypothetical protein
MTDQGRSKQLLNLALGNLRRRVAPPRGHSQGGGLLRPESLVTFEIKYRL